MTLRVVGAGIGRTGTHSLQLALQQLLGGRCYHMMEVFGRPQDVPRWHAAVRGEPVDWSDILGEYVATVDWPGAAFWRELADAYPEAIVLLSTRADAGAWWRSADATIFEISRRPLPGDEALRQWFAMVSDLFRVRFSERWSEEAPAQAAYDAHNAAVRAAIDPARLVEWQPGDGWGPLCRALGVAEPDEPFPHVNSTEEFRTMAGLDAPP